MTRSLAGAGRGPGVCQSGLREAAETIGREQHRVADRLEVFGQNPSAQRFHQRRGYAAQTLKLAKPLQ